MATEPKKISELTELTTSAIDDVLPIVDVAGDETKKQTKENFLKEVQEDADNAQTAAEQAQDDIDEHIADTANPHSTTAGQVGAYTKAETDTKLATKQDKMVFDEPLGAYLV